MYQMDDESIEELVRELPRLRRLVQFGLSHPLGDPALVRDFLAQDQSWCAAGPQYVQIADMTPSHALAAASYILDRATGVALVMLAAGDDEVTEIVVADQNKARLILVDTPLVQALISRGRESVETAKPWEVPQQPPY